MVFSKAGSASIIRQVIFQKQEECHVQHDLEVHGGVEQECCAKIIQKERGLLQLALREALLIEKQKR